MLILRALPLSLSILWRYILVLPVLVIGLAIFVILLGIAALLLGLISPSLSMLLMMGGGAAIGVIPIMVGARLGLQAHGVLGKKSYAKLVMPAMGYGLIESIGATIVILLAFIAFALLSSLGLSDLTAAAEQNSMAALESLNATDGILAVALLVISVLLICTLRAALLYPMTSASVDMDANGRPHTPFLGVGTNILPLFALVVLSYIGFGLLVVLIPLGLIALGYEDALMGAMANTTQAIGMNAPPVLTSADFALLGGFLVISSWMLSLQCAGGVLAFLGQRARQFRQEDVPAPARPAEPSAKVEPKPAPLSTDELRALRKSRQQRTGL